MNRYTIGIDFGTQSGRAVVADVSNGRILAQSERGYAHGVMSDTLYTSGEKLPADFALQEPNDYIEILEYIIPDVIGKAGIDKRDVVGVAIDCTCSTVVALDGDMLPLCSHDEFKREPHAYIKLWKHHGAKEEAGIINRASVATGQNWIDRFGGTVSSEWLYSKVLETIRKAPDVYEKTSYFMEVGDWLTSLLTGNATRGYTAAACKCAYIEENGGYPGKSFFSACDVRMTDIVEEKLRGKIVKMGGLAGCVTKKAAGLFGLPEGIAVASAMTDGHCAVVPLGMKCDGDMCMVMGTSLSMFNMTEKYYPVKGICGSVKDGLMPGSYGYSSGLGCTGELYSWTAENIMTDEYRKEAEDRRVKPIKLLIEKAAMTKPGESGLLALNWFNGNKSLLVDPNLSGMFLGMTLRTRPEEIMRAVIESTAFGARIICEAFTNAGARVNRIAASGGIALKDPFTVQLFSDVLKMDISVKACDQIPALSEAIQASVAAGVYPDLFTASDRMSPPTVKIYRPNTENAKVYDSLYREYVTLHDYFGRGENDVMKRLRNISNSSRS